MTLLSCLWPAVPALHLDAWQMDGAAKRLTLHVTAMQAPVPCPVCRFPTRRIPRRDVRTVADLPWGPWRVLLHRHVRQFFCANSRCSRRIFTARLAHIAMALGGRAGVRLSRALGLSVSRHALRRRRRRLPLPVGPTPQVLGVDDWADQQRQRDGPGLSDLARRRPLALLPDREAKPLALGLQAPPGVGVIPRERSRAYADGARQGAPDALQVADRLHLLQHLAAALDQVCNAHGHTLEAVKAARHRAPVARPDGTVAVPVPPPPLPHTAQAQAHQRQTRRRALPQQIRALHQPGWRGWAIAQQ